MKGEMEVPFRESQRGQRGAVPASYRMTFADWLEMPERGGYTEILHGELLVTPSPAVVHQRIVGNLFRALGDHLRPGGLGEVFLAPTGVRFSDDTVLEPDLVVILGAQEGRVHERHLEAPPDLVVEILSRGTAGRDLGEKRAVYEQAGVREYWIVDPQARTLEVLALADRGYRVSGRFRPGDDVRSPRLPELRLAAADVFPA